MQRQHSTRNARCRLGGLTLLLLFESVQVANAALRPPRATQPSQLPAEAPLLNERQVGRSLNDRLRQMRRQHEQKRQERQGQRTESMRGRGPQASEELDRAIRDESPALRREPVPLPVLLLPANED